MRPAIPRSPTTHRVVTGGDGRPVLVKRATDPAAATRLTGEAAVLRTLAHPGTVTVVAQDADELHLAWVGPHSLATVTGLPVATAGDLVAQVTATVADLHRAGIVHRRLTADHVLLGPSGRAVLTGFADATRAGAGDPPADPADDVAALGALLTRLVAPHDGGPAIPETRRARAGDGGRRAVLLTLADRAQADDPAIRPTAAALAESLRATLGPPPRQLVIRSPGRPWDLITSSRGRGRVLVGVALAACVAATVAAATWITPSSSVEPEGGAVPTTTTVPTPTTSTTSVSSTTTAPATTTTTVPATTTPSCPPVAGPAADVDGDGCAEPVAVDGERVTVDRTTWVAGRPGDMAVVGDWDCDGRATAATLRVGTGEVFVFDRWERALTVDATTRVDGATGLRVVDPDGDGCPTLVVDRPRSAPVTVEVPAA